MKRSLERGLDRVLKAASQKGKHPKGGLLTFVTMIVVSIAVVVVTLLLSEAKVAIPILVVAPPFARL
jgi:hypothetical protein